MITEGGTIMKYTGYIFDLDGVLVDTARYHYLAWKKLAEELGITFTEKDNERLKGVSRMRSLEIILEIGGVSKTEEEKEALCERKNECYLEYVNSMGPNEALPGVWDFLKDAKVHGCKLALGSASKNARPVMDRLGFTEIFDVIADGSMVTRSKPDPEVFVLASDLLGIPTDNCLVFEDAVAGIEAAHAGGMAAVGIGTRENLPEADIIAAGLGELTVDLIEEKFSEEK